MELTKLPKAPLKEVSFEVLWGIGKKEPTLLNRVEGIIGLGKFIDLIQPAFPTYGEKPENALTPYEIAYYFGMAEGDWPKIQYGPGIITINDNHSEYDWNGRFMPLVSRTLECLISAHESLSPIVFTKCTLKYVDAVTLSDSGSTRATIEEFLKPRLNFALGSKMQGAPIVNMKTLFEIRVEDVSVILSLGTGTLKGEDAFIWESSIPFEYPDGNLGQILESANRAHDLLSKFFKNLCTETFRNEFL